MSLSRDILLPVTTNLDSVTDKRTSRKGKTYEEIYGLEKAKEQKEKRSKIMMGHLVSEETRKKISQKNFGKCFADPWNKGLHGNEYLSHYNGAKIWNKGVPMKEESKEKLRSQRLNTKLSEESKSKISESIKRKLETDPTYRENISHGLRRKIRNDPEWFIAKQLKASKKSHTRINTSIELKVQASLRKSNLPFITQKFLSYGELNTFPDIVLTPLDLKICIYCDGDYWHNYPFGTEKDKEINKVLSENGWVVLRFWGSEINKNLNLCLEKMVDTYQIRVSWHNVSCSSHIDSSDSDAKYGCTSDMNEKTSS